MFHPRHRIHAAWLLLFGVVVLVAGCGQEKSTSPLDQPPDTAPPGAPTGLVVSLQTDTKFTLEWTPCAEPNVVGYIVYRYDPDPSRTSSYVAINQNPISVPRFTIAGTPGTTYYFRVTAYDVTPKESAMSDPLPFTFQVSEGGSLPNEDGTDDTTWRGSDEVGSDHQGERYQTGDLPIRR